MCTIRLNVHVGWDVRSYILLVLASRDHLVAAANLRVLLVSNSNTILKE